MAKPCAMRFCFVYDRGLAKTICMNLRIIAHNFQNKKMHAIKRIRLVIESKAILKLRLTTGATI